MQHTDHACEVGGEFAVLAPPVAKFHGDSPGNTVQEQILLLLAQLFDRCVEIEPEPVCDTAEQRNQPVSPPGGLSCIRRQRSLIDGQGLIRDYAGGVELGLGSKAMAVGASSVRRIERKGARCNLFNADTVVTAGKVFRKEHLLASNDVDGDTPFCFLERSLQRVCEAAFDAGLDHQSVEDDIDCVLLELVEDDLFRCFPQFAVDTYTCVTFFAQVFEFLAVFAFSALDQRRDYLNTCAFR